MGNIDVTFNFPTEFEPVHFLHHHITDDEVNVILFKDLQRFLSTRSRYDKIFLGQNFGKEIQNLRVVVHNHNGILFFQRFTGKSAFQFIFFYAVFWNNRIFHSFGHLWQSSDGRLFGEIYRNRNTVFTAFPIADFDLSVHQLDE